MTQEEMEQEALKMLHRRLREGRRVPRRHMFVALFVVLPALLAVIVLGIWLSSLI